MWVMRNKGESVLGVEEDPSAWVIAYLKAQSEESGQQELHVSG